MVTKKDKNAQRLKRHRRVRGKISGTTERPRLAVYRSNANIYAQIIDDVNGQKIAEKALAAGITEVVFDRGGYIYHGRVSELAAGAREGGLKF